jgi:putative oligomerization/nucleic acid binding protein
MRTYDTDAAGQKLFEREAAMLANKGYVLQGQSQTGGHFHAGRLILTGGLSVFAGRRGTRSKGKVTVTFMKVAVAPAAVAAPPAPSAPEQPRAPDPLAQIERLSELRDRGVITAEDFEAKKAELLRRL